MDQWLARLDRIKAWQVAIIIALTGTAVYFSGLTNPFQGDDFPQIVNNVPVHSISNFPLFFEGGTFYNNHGLAPLSGVYFRPLMTTTFSLLYSLFGPHPFYYHLTQLLLSIGSAFFLYLFFKYSFKSWIALCLSLIFLVHPLTSQVVFAIPTMQDALCFFFGILALWLLLRYSSVRSLAAVTVCILLSLLSKESGIVFVILSLTYLSVWDRKRLWPTAGFLVPSLICWLILKIHAVGLNAPASLAPIDKVSLLSRLLTAPSIGLFYVSKFIMPINIGSAYYWVHTNFSLVHVIVPLIADAICLGIFIFFGIYIRNKATKARLYTYLFFAAWASIGLLAYSQIIPLDMTASGTWFYIPMAGLLGMIGVLLQNIHFRSNQNLVTAVAIFMAAVVVLGLLTVFRGFEYKNEYSLAVHDVNVSKDNYVAYYVLAGIAIKQGNYPYAKSLAQSSVNIYPSFTNLNDLGLACASLGQYACAKDAYSRGLKDNQYFSELYRNMASLSIVYGDAASSKRFYALALHYFPQDPMIWSYLAMFEEKNHDNAAAKIAISNAAKSGHISPELYDYIMQDESFTLNLPNLGTSLNIP